MVIMRVNKYLKADNALLSNLKELTEESARKDGFMADIHLDTSMNAQKDMPAIFTYEDGKSLIALLFVFAPGRDEIEVNALVHPEYRNKGVFRNLMREAAHTASDCGYSKGLFVCGRESATGQGVVRHWGCELDHAELQMSCGIPAADEYNNVEVAEAREADIEELSCLGAAAFDMDKEFERELIKNSLAADDRIQYVANCDGKMVGLCAAAESEGKMMIFGLGVHPYERRKGYARALLARAAADAVKKGIHELCLDVDEDNPAAIALYESFGFKTTGCTEYYSFEFDIFI